MPFGPGVQDDRCLASMDSHALPNLAKKSLLESSLHLELEGPDVSLSPRVMLCQVVGESIGHVPPGYALAVLVGPGVGAVPRLACVDRREPLAVLRRAHQARSGVQRARAMVSQASFPRWVRDAENTISLGAGAGWIFTINDLFLLLRGKGA